MCDADDDKVPCLVYMGKMYLYACVACKGKFDDTATFKTGKLCLTCGFYSERTNGT